MMILFFKALYLMTPCGFGAGFLLFRALLFLSQLPQLLALALVLA